MQGNFFNLASRCAACAHRPLCFPALPRTSSGQRPPCRLPRRLSLSGKTASIAREDRKFVPVGGNAKIGDPAPLSGSHAGVRASRSGPLLPEATGRRLRSAARTAWIPALEWSRPAMRGLRDAGERDQSGLTLRGLVGRIVPAHQEFPAVGFPAAGCPPKPAAATLSGAAGSRSGLAEETSAHPVRVEAAPCTERESFPRHCLSRLRGPPAPDLLCPFREFDHLIATARQGLGHAGARWHTTAKPLPVWQSRSCFTTQLATASEHERRRPALRVRVPHENRTLSRTTFSPGWPVNLFLWKRGKWIRSPASPAPFRNGRAGGCRGGFANRVRFAFRWPATRIDGSS